MSFLLEWFVSLLVIWEANFESETVVIIAKTTLHNERLFNVLTPSYSDLSFLPDHILIDLFLRTLRAGKLTEKILKLFISTGKEEVHSLIQALNIKHVLNPVLPTRCSERF
ncbi:uncharacterized protein LOC108202880 [Daucus carota subsp. sativus]|uniref:uncharacterized protein LOC108202880 n=1 Tax=Daucus carota subsp. sativus TaxID=79200 RepID=UPI0030834FA4